MCTVLNIWKREHYIGSFQMRVPTATMHESVCQQIQYIFSFTVCLPTSSQLVPLACKDLVHLLHCRDLPVLAQEVELLLN